MFARLKYNLKWLSSLFALWALVHLATHGAEKNNALLVNFGTMLAGNYEVSYERTFDKRLTLSIIGGYYDARAALVRVYSYGYQPSLGIAPKLHIWGSAHGASLYFAPSLKIGYLEHWATADQPADRSLLFRTGALVGYHLVFLDRWVFDTHWGLEHYQAHPLDTVPTRLVNEKPIMVRPVASVSLGFTW